MSQENTEVVQRLVQAFCARDAQTVASILDAGIEFESALVEHKTSRALEFR
jgi:hypothetical protein